MEAGAFPAELVGVARRGPWRQAAARFWRRPLGVAAFALVAVFFLISLLAPVVAPYPVGKIFLELIQHPEPPLSAHHLLGTDILGRDYYSQLLWAIRETMLSAFLCAGICVGIGGTVGLVAGYTGRWLDALSGWVMRVVVSVPAIVVIAYASTRSKVLLTPFQNAIWLSIVLWPSVARVVSANVASLRRRDFVEAAQVSGASAGRIVFRHLLPNTIGVIVVAATSIVGQAVAIIATVQYLGYSFNNAHQPTLGGLVADSTAAPQALFSRVATLWDLWWLYALPAAILVVMLLGVTFLGDALDEALNPASAA